MSEPLPAKAAEPDKIEWSNVVTARMLQRPAAVRAVTYQHTYDSISKPIRVTASDGKTYVVKGPGAGKQPVNDQIVGRLGIALGAPVADVSLVEVPQELIEAEPELLNHPLVKPYPAGIWHGSLFRSDYSDTRQGWQHATVAENADGFARLAVLYGWGACFQDHQFLYRKVPPPLVLSHDHGHFFPGGPEWSVGSLATASKAIPDPIMVSQCKLTDTALNTATQTLKSIDATQIISEAVAAVPDPWPISMAERVAMAEFLYNRCIALRSHKVP